MKISVIDDNNDLRTMIGFVLRGLGHEVLEADEGNAGLAQLKKEQPDLALIDIGLPNLSGDEVVRQYRAAVSPAAKTYIVAVSGYSDEANRQRAREAGCDAYLVKPVPLAALKQLVSDRSHSRAPP